HAPTGRRPPFHPTISAPTRRHERSSRLATTLLRPDQSFYPSARLAAEAPVETLAYMVTFDPTRTKPDALVSLDVDKKSPGYGKQVGRADAPNVGDEFHHFGWNVCS